MPRIYGLGNYAQRLKGVALIIGDGLCSNIYVIGASNAVVVDTGVGNRTNPVWPQLEELGITPENLKGVVLTHAHHDHAMGTFIILDKADPKVFIHSRDTKYIASSLGDNLVTVEDGDIIETELWPLRVIWTPGHTEGGMCLYNEDEGILFSGDTVFPDGNFGRYDGESGSIEALRKSLRKLSRLQVEIMLPGHGSPVLKGAGEQIKRSYNNAFHYA